jgi:hypothetical protein
VTPDVIVSIDYGVTPRVQQDFIMRPRQSDAISLPGIGVDVDGNRITPKSPTLERVAVMTTTYEKYLRLVARENQSAEKEGVPAEIWSVDVSSEGQSKNLREYLPVLVAASIEYVGRDSNGQKTIRIKDTDADVVFVKKGM